MIPITAKAEAENLMRELFSFAKKMLSQYGEFHPFGGYLDVTGRMVHVGLDGESGEGRSGREELTLLKDALKSIANRDGGRVFGYAANVTLSTRRPETEAIQFFLEHKGGYCAEVFFVYVINSAREVEIIEKFAKEGTPLFFA